MIGFGPLTDDQKEELLVSAQQVPFALMTAQLEAAEDTLGGGDDDLPGTDDPSDEESDPAVDDDTEVDPEGTGGQADGE